MWYLCFLPIVLASHRLPSRYPNTTLAMLVGWIVGQAVWLGLAYQLEIVGENYFRMVEVASWLFFVVNVWILYVFIDLLNGPNRVSGKAKEE